MFGKLSIVGLLLVQIAIAAVEPGTTTTIPPYCEFQYGTTNNADGVTSATVRIEVDGRFQTQTSSGSEDGTVSSCCTTVICEQPDPTKPPTLKEICEAVSDTSICGAACPDIACALEKPTWVQERERLGAECSAITTYGNDGCPVCPVPEHSWKCTCPPSCECPNECSDRCLKTAGDWDVFGCPTCTAECPSAGCDCLANEECVRDPLTENTKCCQAVDCTTATFSPAEGDEMWANQCRMVESKDDAGCSICVPLCECPVCPVQTDMPENCEIKVTDADFTVAPDGQRCSTCPEPTCPTRCPECDPGFTCNFDTGVCDETKVCVDQQTAGFVDPCFEKRVAAEGTKCYEPKELPYPECGYDCVEVECRPQCDKVCTTLDDATLLAEGCKIVGYEEDVNGCPTNCGELSCCKEPVCLNTERVLQPGCERIQTVDDRGCPDCPVDVCDCTTDNSCPTPCEGTIDCPVLTEAEIARGCKHDRQWDETCNGKCTVECPACTTISLDTCADCIEIREYVDENGCRRCECKDPVDPPCLTAEGTVDGERCCDVFKPCPEPEPDCKYTGSLAIRQDGEVCVQDCGELVCGTCKDRAVPCYSDLEIERYRAEGCTFTEGEVDADGCLKTCGTFDCKICPEIQCAAPTLPEGYTEEEAEMYCVKVDTTLDYNSNCPGCPKYGHCRPKDDTVCPRIACVATEGCWLVDGPTKLDENGCPTCPPERCCDTASATDCPTLRERCVEAGGVFRETLTDDKCASSCQCDYECTKTCETMMDADTTKAYCGAGVELATDACECRCKSPDDSVIYDVPVGDGTIKELSEIADAIATELGLNPEDINIQLSESTTGDIVTVEVKAPSAEEGKAVVEAAQANVFEEDQASPTPTVGGSSASALGLALVAAALN